MTTVGVYCRSHEDASAEASVVAVDGECLIEQVIVEWSGADAMPAALEELRAATTALLAETGPTSVAVWALAPKPFGVAGGFRAASAGIRAEGVIIAAAAARGVPACVRDRQSVLMASTEGRIDDAVRDLTSWLPPDTAATVRRAAAIALT